MISLLIASYPGKERNIECQGKCISITLERLKKCSMKNIDRIVIIRTKYRNRELGQYENYYPNISKVNHVPVIYFDYIGDNTHHCYDQWIQYYDYLNK